MSKPFSWKRVGLLVGVGVVIGLGNFHVVHGSTYTGGLLVPRLSFGYSELVINTDVILNMPVISAKSQYPLSVAALQKRGYLESDEVRMARIKQEVAEQLRPTTERSVEDQLYKLDHGHYPDEQ